MKDAPQHPNFEALLLEAITKPGKVEQAFRAFHGYSLGNQMLALFQCAARGITPGPIATYPGWLAKGRHVRKGERAIVLCMPVTCKTKEADQTESPDQADKAAAFTRFIYRPNWFVLAQTDGAELALPNTPTFDTARALRALAIEQVEFSHPNGNVQGYARGRQVAVSPVAQLPAATLFHELAHVVLGHTEKNEQMADGASIPRNLREVEAESVALLCCESLGFEGAEYARGYIQSWLQGDTIPEKSAQRIFKAADQILKAGTAEAAQATEAA